MAFASIEVLLVICADRLDNIKSIASEYEPIGDKDWKRFNRGREPQFWYYSSVPKGFEKKLATSKYRHLLEELKSEIQKLFRDRLELLPEFCTNLIKFRARNFLHAEIQVHYQLVARC